MAVTFIRLAHNGEWKAPTQYIRYVPTLTPVCNSADGHQRNKTEPFEELTTPNTNVNTRLYNFPTFISDYPESVRVSTSPKRGLQEPTRASTQSCY